ncbi:SLC13 family permease [Staphylococcus massiliensis]|uniref:SLC13 family permease n=1 Tax=Staphylococcus massiliensis TaxID=555791 RepID=UPI001EDEFC0D|nr:SLC13 family permease [Staphylococcus massiliensis]MCG3400586.1 anion permease [Staphylococcus massiliensis]
MQTKHLLLLIIYLITSILVFIYVDLDYLGKVSIIIFLLSLGLFIFSKVPAGLVGMLVLMGGILLGLPESILFESLNQHIVWLMIGAFIISGIIEESGLLQRFVKLINRKCESIQKLTLFTFIKIQCLSLIIPSTSSRAMAMLPIYRAMTVKFPSQKLFLGLLIPTLILIASNLSLIGAGSHLVAIGILEKQTSKTISYLDFLIWGLPFGILFGIFATCILYVLTKENVQRSHDIDIKNEAEVNFKVPFSQKEKTTIICVVITLLLWVLEPLHGLDIAFTTILMALIMLLPQLNLLHWKKGLKHISWSLIFFVASSSALGELLVGYNVVTYLQSHIMQFLKSLGQVSELMIVIVIIVISVFSHLVITSHTTRAVVLIPAFIVFAKLFQLNEVAVVFLALIGINYCLTFPISSKAILVFYEEEDKPFEPKHLFKLSCILMPLYCLFMLGMYFTFWKFIGLELM